MKLFHKSILNAKLPLTIFFSFINLAFADEADLSDLKLKKIFDTSPYYLSLSEEYKLNEAESYQNYLLKSPEIKFEKMDMEADGVWTLSQKIPSIVEWAYLNSYVDSQLKSQKANTQQKINIESNTIYQLKFEENLLLKRKNLILEQQKILDQLLLNFKNQYVLEKMSQSEFLNAQVEKIKKTEELLDIESEIIKNKNELELRVSKSNLSISLNVYPLIFKTDKEVELLLNDEVKLSENVNKTYQVQSLINKLESQKNLSSSKKGKFFPEIELMYLKQGSNFGYGVALEVPIWGATELRNEVQMANSNYILTQYELEITRREVLVAIKNLLFRYQQLLKKKKFYESGLLALAQQSYVSSQSSYKTGKVKYTDLLNSLNNYFETQYSFEEIGVELQKINMELNLLYNFAN